jgi:hypothetical protein
LRVRYVLQTSLHFGRFYKRCGRIEKFSNWVKVNAHQNHANMGRI